MTIEKLNLIKKVYIDIETGISYPIEINEAYSYIPDLPTEVPMRARIRAITRFYMLLWNDMYKAIINQSQDSTETSLPTESNTVSVNNNNQSHSEDSKPFEDSKLPLDFLTGKEKTKNNAKTKFVHKRASNKSKLKK